MSVDLFDKKRIKHMENKFGFAAGKAALALSQMMNCKVDVNFSSLHLVALTRLSDIFDGFNENVLGVRMNMFGDVKGDIYFLICEKDKWALMQEVSEATFGKGSGLGMDISILEEVGNIIAGVYLTAIHEISGLTIYQSIPTVASGIFSSLIDEAIAKESMANPYVLVIETQFTVTKDSTKTFLLLIPSSDFIFVLLDAIDHPGNRHA